MKPQEWRLCLTEAGESTLECASIELAQALTGWAPLSCSELKKIEKVTSAQQSQLHRVLALHSVLQQHKNDLGQVHRGIVLALGTALNYIRGDRNDAGHPSGRVFEHVDAQIVLNLSGLMAHRLYELKDELGRIKGCL